MGHEGNDANRPPTVLDKLTCKLCCSKTTEISGNMYVGSHKSSNTPELRHKEANAIQCALIAFGARKGTKGIPFHHYIITASTLNGTCQR
eukprot:6492635-Amphidinium_carterae.1